MFYLYHRVPSNFKGETIYPLNQLKEIYPEIYQVEVRKYNDREYLLEERIPQLDCLWNDVLHLIAVHPSVVREAFQKIGKPLKGEYFQIPVNLIQQENALVYLYKYKDRQDKWKKDNYESFNPQNIKGYQVTVDQLIQNQEEQIRNGKEPLLFFNVPHILYKGTINTHVLARV